MSLDPAVARQQPFQDVFQVLHLKGSNVIKFSLLTSLFILVVLNFYPELKISPLHNKSIQNITNDFESCYFSVLVCLILSVSLAVLMLLKKKESSPFGWDSFLIHHPPAKSQPEAINRFDEIITLLPDIHDSEAYGLLLRESEQLLLTLNENKEERIELYRKAFQNAPKGLGVLTLVDVIGIERFSVVPQGVTYKNCLGETFLQPPISVNQLQSLFFQLGYTKIMHSRGKEFDGKQEVSDVIMVGDIKLGFFSSLDTEVQKISDYFSRNNKFLELGYVKIEVRLLNTLQDQEKAMRLQEQGFQVCVELTYPPCKGDSSISCG